mgnify:CR=1 FL=1
MQEFFTRSIANEGVKLPLSYPDGSLSDHWIRVRGIDSDDFRKVEAVSKRKAVALSNLDDEAEREQAIKEIELECIAALVAEWSFDEECNHENIIKLLTEAPQVANAINIFAARRKDFFAKKS